MVLNYKHIRMTKYKRNAKKEKEASRLRHQLRQTEKQRDKYLNKILQERGPMIRGTFVIQGCKCGKKNCRCTRGELHTTVVLYSSEKGKTKTTYIRPPDRALIQQLSRTYQRFRRSRAELAKLAKQTLELIDALQALLTESYPPGGSGTSGGGGKHRGKGKDG
jgi:hypothetical protein